ncbi:MAG: RNA polymerase sporulation sigma factor SigK [Peptococcaceae bacterium]|jgi:RNA polymerase sporulation-specific sigma factor|nr:RNA polymerase sporulation sigma factor SigK [Peptococcaceae bacterium]
MALGTIIITAAALVNSFLMVAHYLNSNSFPQPLSEAEEAKHLKELEAGSEKAKGILIERNLRLVAHVVKKFESNGEDRDDLISIGTIGLIKAVQTYNTAKGAKLATYAARCIENEILMHLRAGRKTRGEVSLYDSVGVDKEGNPVNLIDVLGSGADAVPDEVQNRIEYQQLLEKVNGLNDRERMIMELRFGLSDGSRRTQLEIAKILGISRSYISRIEKRAVEKLVKEIKK